MRQCQQREWQSCVVNSACLLSVCLCVCVSVCVCQCIGRLCFSLRASTQARPAAAGSCRLSVRMSVRPSVLFASPPLTVRQGIIDFLLGESRVAAELRGRFVFKLVPMLNPDGVINGNNRTSLSVRQSVHHSGRLHD